jgi:hypothetical protein
MEDNRLEDFEVEVLNFIFKDALSWLINKFGDRSVALNKVNYKKKLSPFRKSTFKHALNFSWDLNPRNLSWHYYGQWAEYNGATNTIYLGCTKKETLKFALECLFHEFKHSQQSMATYIYIRYKTAYENHPFEKEADDFASEWVPVYIKERLIEDLFK